MSIRKNRQTIYVGPDLQRLLDGRPKEKLSTVVNLLAERYSGMVERADDTRPYCMWAEFMCNVLREARHPLSSKEIAAFPGMVKDWVARNPEYKAVGGTLVTVLENTPYINLVKLVDKLEKQL